MSDTNLKRELTQGGVLGLGVVLVLGILIAINYLAWRHHDRFDWTSSELYTLSDKSENILRSLDQDLEIVTVMDPQVEVHDQLRELLARYAAATPRITVRELDPFRNPAEAKLLIERLGLSRADVVVIAKADGSDKRIVETANLAEYDYSGAQYGEAPTMKAFNGEREITRAIVDLVSSSKPVVRFTTGHGEASLDGRDARGLSTAAELLGGDNLELEEWASLGAADVPPETELVVIAGPTTGFVAPELASLDRFLARGGRVLVAVDPTLSPDGQLVESGLREWLSGHGVALGDDIVVDPSNPLPFFGAETIFASDWADHPVTESFSDAQLSVVLSLARSVGATSTASDPVVLVKTSAAGWGETNLAGLPQVEKNETDLAGPVGLAVAVEVPAGSMPPAPVVEPTDDGVTVDGEDELASAADPVEQETPSESIAEAETEPETEPEGEAAASAAGRLLVVGDADFLTDGFIRNAGNANFLANIANWMLERTSQLGIEAKAPEQVRLTMTGSQMSAARWLVLGGLPLAAVICGVAVQRRRKSR